jgi:hypothetical protein
VPSTGTALNFEKIIFVGDFFIFSRCGSPPPPVGQGLLIIVKFKFVEVAAGMYQIYSLKMAL